MNLARLNTTQYQTHTEIANRRLSRHILTYSHWYDDDTIQKAKENLRKKT
ncbi:hypothetical protein NSQ26_10305 [Bacillus sp. FSL W7-1360]